MTKRHIIAFAIGVLVAWMARNEAVRSVLQSAIKPSLLFRSVSFAEPRAVIMDGDFPVCSAVVAGDALYTAGHCVRGVKEGDEVEVLLQKGEEPTRQTVYVYKVDGEIAILTFAKTAEVETPKAEVKAGARVVAVMGILLSSDPDVYRASLPYFEREGKVLAVFTAKEIGMTDIAPHIPPTAKFALIDVGSFSGNSGSGVYIVDEQGKRHLIGVVSAGVSDYTVVALF